MLLVGRYSGFVWLRISQSGERLDSRTVDRDRAEAMLASLSRAMPSCEAEIRQQLPDLAGPALEAEAFRLALRKLDLTLSYDAYRYIKWRYEESRRA